jgi:hypothetical protein
MIIAALTVTCSAPGETDSSDLEDRIWALEERYVSAYRNADHDSILALMDEGFLGWPDSEESPTALGQVPRFLRENYGAAATWDYRIDRAGIRIAGDVVITHYVLIVANNGVEQATRITHTWVRRGADWKILGGMSQARPTRDRASTAEASNRAGQ